MGSDTGHVSCHTTGGFYVASQTKRLSHWGPGLPSLPKVFDIQVGLESRVLFLENRLRELNDVRKNPLDSSARLARVDTETAIINLMLAHYRAAADLERRLNDSSTNS